MINYRKRNEINEMRWNALVEQHPTGLPYAYTWYLDIVCPDWSAFVYGDYEAVMPLPIAQKFVVNYVYQPNYCQQLGVFALSDDVQVFDAFYTALRKKFWFFHVQQNPIFPSNKDLFGFKEKTNLTLSLQPSYAEIQQQYSESTKRNVNRGKKLSLIYSVDEMSTRRFVEVYSANTIGVPKTKITELIKTLSAQGMLSLLSVKSEFLEVLAADVVIKTPKRLVHLIPVTTPNGRTQGAMHFLIDQLIQQHAGTDMVLDFEGSSVENIARFYKSFGATEENFFDIRKRI